MFEWCCACCKDFEETCGNKNIKCGSNQTYREPDTTCDGTCENYGGTCCVDVTHTCGNQNIICRPGYYVKGYHNESCAVDGCKNHGKPCAKNSKKLVETKMLFAALDKPTKYHPLFVTTVPITMKNVV